MGDIFRFTILGCSSSGGVPRIGNDWGACDPKEPKNRRRRCSLLVRRIRDNDSDDDAKMQRQAISIVEDGAHHGPRGPERNVPPSLPPGVPPPRIDDPNRERETRVLIDTSPDLREQLLSAGVGVLDAVLYTHEHADHIHGIDDLRGVYFNRGRRRVPCYANARTADILVRSFGYCFSTPPGYDYPPIAELNRIEEFIPVSIEGAGGNITALPVDLEHGRFHSFGFVINGVAYTPDLNGIPEATIPHLEGLKVWIVDALRPGPKPHPTHFILEETLKWIDRLQPERAILTNLHTLMDYRTLKETLPKGVEPAYDGLTIDLPVLT